MPLRSTAARASPVPRCGTTIEAVFFAEHQMNYCPKEQTAGASSRTGGSRGSSSRSYIS